MANCVVSSILEFNSELDVRLFFKLGSASSDIVMQTGLSLTSSCPRFAWMLCRCPVSSLRR